MYHQRVLVHHLPIYLFSWQLHVTQQHNELLRFNCNSGYANAPKCYVVRTLPILFKFDFVLSLFCVFSFVVCCLYTRLVFLCCLCNSIYGCCASALIIKNLITNIYEFEFFISNLRRVLNVVCFLLGNSPASEFHMSTFRNTLFQLHRRISVKNY
jgi:hypothetical protein